MNSNETREHLRLLSIFHYVVGGLAYLFSLFPVIHLTIGLIFMLTPMPVPAPTPEGAPPALETAPPTPEAAPPLPEAVPPPPGGDVFPMRVFGAFFVVIASIIIVCGMTVATCIVMAGRRLAQYRRHTFCLVVAGIECLFMPFGTVLGVFTIIVLQRPEARRLFGLDSGEGEETAESDPLPSPPPPEA